MRDKTFHALCAANALQAMIAKHPPGVVRGDDAIYAQMALGAMLYADRMVELRKLRRWPYRVPFELWMANWSVWLHAISEQE